LRNLLLGTILTLLSSASFGQALPSTPDEEAAHSIMPGFPTLEEAAIAGFKAVAQHPNALHYEWGGIIVKAANGFIALPANTSFEGSHVHIQGYELPPGVQVATYHTHPCLQEFLTEYFSPADLTDAVFFHAVVFMGDFCKGLAHEFIPGDKPDAEPVGGNGMYLTKGRIIGKFTTEHPAL
jgi:hypothetical protein